MCSPWSSETDEFLALLLGSGLLEAKEIRNLCEELEVDSDSRLALEKISEHFVAKGSITQWQCDKLKSRKYRGFFLDNYKLLDQIERDDLTTTYLAIDLESSRHVGLRVTPPNDDMRMSYDVIDLDH